MKWILAIVGVLVILVLVVLIVGYSLPVAHVASRSATLKASPSDVYAAITDASAFPSWRSDVKVVDVLPPVNGQASWREKGENGVITFVVVRADPPRSVVTRIADKDLPFGGEWEYTLTPTGTGTTLTITERGEVYNPIFRFVSRFVMGHTATIDAYLAALSKKFGGEATPVH
jgi:uncharacterized protein YndB with AHSA1/START domain